MRSNGTVTYTGRISPTTCGNWASSDWTFITKPVRRDHRGLVIWTTTGEKSEAVANHPPFGAGTAFLVSLTSASPTRRPTSKKA